MARGYGRCCSYEREPMEENYPRILLIEDDDRAALLMRETLEDHFTDVHVDTYSLVRHLTKVDPYNYDIVLTDMNFPDGTGLDILAILLNRRRDIPIVVVTADVIMENAVTAIQRGAYDYVVKAGDYLFALPVVVEKNLALYRMKRENEQLRGKLERTLDQLKIKNEQLESVIVKLEDMAATDPLTGLANRRAFARALTRYFASATRQSTDLSCIMIDLDGFKNLNDTLGHQTGDRLLQHTSRILQHFIRQSDLAGRFGGDEFVLLLPNTDQNTALQVAQRIQQTFTTEITNKIQFTHPEIVLSMSMGLATLKTSRASTPQRLIDLADQALYAAKSAGKRQIKIYQPRTTTLSA
ncbi:diguanylate cyclase [Planctomycetota bacterium]|nr:diguanylate cyclase [Planctomycetota bacterium]